MIALVRSDAIPAMSTPSTEPTEAARRGGFLATVQKHAVALISLCVALTGLGYNTWRNETTESHRNVRQAAFAILSTLGELQQVVQQRYYAGKGDDITRINGWGKVALVRDMGTLVSPETSRQSARLFATWADNLDRMDAGQADAEHEISGAIMATREQVLRDLEALR